MNKIKQSLPEDFKNSSLLTKAQKIAQLEIARGSIEVGTLGLSGLVFAPIDIGVSIARASGKLS